MWGQRTRTHMHTRKSQRGDDGGIDGENGRGNWVDFDTRRWGGNVGGRGACASTISARNRPLVGRRQCGRRVSGGHTQKHRRRNSFISPFCPVSVNQRGHTRRPATSQKRPSATVGDCVATRPLCGTLLFSIECGCFFPCPISARPLAPPQDIVSFFFVLFPRRLSPRFKFARTCKGRLCRPVRGSSQTRALRIRRRRRRRVRRRPSRARCSRKQGRGATDGRGTVGMMQARMYIHGGGGAAKGDISASSTAVVPFALFAGTSGACVPSNARRHPFCSPLQVPDSQPRAPSSPRRTVTRRPRRAFPANAGWRCNVACRRTAAARLRRPAPSSALRGLPSSTP